MTSYIGYGAGAQGVVSITNDSVLTSAYNAYIGYSADSSGTVNLNGSEGACGWIIQKSLFIGKEGQGTLNITDGGGVASGGEIYLGYTSGSAGEVKISGTDTGLLTDSSLYVGYNGTGTLSLTNGATATAGKIFIRTGTMSLTNGATVTTDTAYMAKWWDSHHRWHRLLMDQQRTPLLCTFDSHCTQWWAHDC